LKKTVFVLLFCYISSLQAERFALEVKASYLFPLDHSFRKIYSERVVLGVELDCKILETLEAFLTIENWNAHGRYDLSSTVSEKSVLRAWPLSLGLKQWITVNCFSLYVGGAFVLDQVGITNETVTLDRKIRQNGYGFQILGGLSTFLTEDWFLDLFGSYTTSAFRLKSQNALEQSIFNFSTNRIQLGGGLGFTF
jgi:opacity protein-like surface antigen